MSLTNGSSRSTSTCMTILSYAQATVFPLIPHQERLAKKFTKMLLELESARIELVRQLMAMGLRVNDATCQLIQDTWIPEIKAVARGKRVPKGYLTCLFSFFANHQDGWIVIGSASLILLSQSLIFSRRLEISSWPVLSWQRTRQRAQLLQACSCSGRQQHIHFVYLTAAPLRYFFPNQ